MNIQEYISSGIVEAYVLGLASAEERAEFERMCDAHAEVKAARDSFELQLEEYSLASATQPPKHLRSQILAEIEIQKDRSGFTSQSFNSDGDGATVEAPVIRSTNWIRYLAAASVVLLVGSLAFNLYYYNRYKEVNASYESLVQQQTEMANNYKKQQVEFDEYKAAMQKLSDPAMAVIRMSGGAVPTSPDPSSLATVYWDTRTKDVFLKVNNMPEPSSDLQYQLWAIVDGVPVDAGVFNMDGNSLYVTMKNIPKAQAFAITLEKKGGSPTPQGKMYVLGKV